MEQVSLSQLFFLYLRVASLTFGGGDPTMAALQSEMVVSRRWLPAEKYALVYALARITPGTNMLAFGAGAGWLLRGWAGAVCAVLAMSIPAAILVVLLTLGYEAWRSNRLAMAAIAGTLAAATGMMATSAWQLLRPYLTRRRTLHAIVIAGGSLALSLGLSLSPIQILGLGALAGFLWRIPE